MPGCQTLCSVPACLRKSVAGGPAYLKAGIKFDGKVTLALSSSLQQVLEARALFRRDLDLQKACCDQPLQQVMFVRACKLAHLQGDHEGSS